MDGLHSRGSAEPVNGWKMGRYKFFMLVAGGTFVWQWVPNAIAPFVASIGQFPTWIAPNNVVVNQVRPISQLDSETPRLIMIIRFLAATTD